MNGFSDQGLAMAPGVDLSLIIKGHHMVVVPGYLGNEFSLKTFD